jgi:hypothetical protein
MAVTNSVLEYGQALILSHGILESPASFELMIGDLSRLLSVSQMNISVRYYLKIVLKE